MSDQRDIDEPEEEHVRSTSAEELATEDTIEQVAGENPDRSPLDASPDSGSDGFDPGRQNPIIPGEGKIEEPT